MLITASHPQIRDGGETGDADSSIPDASCLCNRHQSLSITDDAATEMRSIKAICLSMAQGDYPELFPQAALEQATTNK